jgi:hypothetical protein
MVPHISPLLRDVGILFALPKDIRWTRRRALTGTDTELAAFPVYRELSLVVRGCRPVQALPEWS